MEQRICPSGHIHTVDKFHSYVKLDVEDPDLAIVFDCPGGKREHQFTLRKAVAAGMFTIEEAARIRQTGLALQESTKEGNF